MIAAIALLGDAPLPKIQPRGLRREPTKFTAEVRQYILDHRNQSVKKIHADLVSLGHRVSMEGIYQVQDLDYWAEVVTTPLHLLECLSSCDCPRCEPAMHPPGCQCLEWCLNEKLPPLRHSEPMLVLAPRWPREGAPLRATALGGF